MKIFNKLNRWLTSLFDRDFTENEIEFFQRLTDKELF